MARGLPWRLWALPAIAAVGATALWAWSPANVWWAERSAVKDLERRVAATVPYPATDPEPCPWQRPAAESRPPLVLLVLGQSNAANHGAEDKPGLLPGPPGVTVTDGLRCWRVADPLPGGTGRGQSVWSRLEAALLAQGVDREVVVQVLAVDSTRVQDWVLPNSPLSRRLDVVLAGRAGSRPVDLVLWQQGESDARAGTSAQDYASELLRLVAKLRQAGIHAPVLAARSTRCRNDSGNAVRLALAQVAAANAGVRLGPDTDALRDDQRVHDCHFTAQGLDAAAMLWARSVMSHLP